MEKKGKRRMVISKFSEASFQEADLQGASFQGITLLRETIERLKSLRRKCQKQGQELGLSLVQVEQMEHMTTAERLRFLEENATFSLYVPTKEEKSKI